MMKRFALLGLLALSLGASGCAATARRTDGTPILGNQAWQQAPAPPQRPVALASKTTAETSDNPNTTPAGLSKYFPGLHRNLTEAPKVVANYHPTWFGLRPRPAQSQVYATDARSGMNRSVQETASTLPVALQVPTDRAVRPTNAETYQQPITNPVTMSNPADQDLLSSSVGHDLPVYGGRASKPVNDEVNPLPPAAESQAALANRMPEVPVADPVAVPTAAVAEPVPASATPEVKPEAIATSLEVKTETAPVSPEPKPEPVQAPITTPAPTPSATPELKTEPVTNPAGDEKAVQAVPTPITPSMAAGLPEATLPASYLHHHKSKAVATSQTKAAPVVLASPQSPPPPAKVLPTSQANPNPQVLPTSQAKTLGETCTEKNCCEGQGWKRPCLRRLVRRVCKMGEFATPATAAPH